jgi:signal transduction histidine kinase
MEAPRSAPQAEVGPDEAQRWYRSQVALVSYAVGGLVFLVGYVQWRLVLLDQTRRHLEHVLSCRAAEVSRQNRQLESYNRELIRTNQRLRDTIEEKSRLLGVATHDLKNPLFGMRALSEILLETEALSDRGRRKVELIRQSAEDTLEQISDLMASAASTGGEIDRQPVDLAALAEWVVRSFAPQAQRKEQTVHCAVPDGPCVVSGDRRKLREAMTNLVSNALKYSPPGTAVDVAVRRERETIRVAVTDQGPGLSPRDQERLFAPFQRLTPKPTGDEGSSGLGLYIVKQIVALHGGDVEVDTAMGEGSTFALVLPALDAEVLPRDWNEAVEHEV